MAVAGHAVPLDPHSVGQLLPVPCEGKPRIGCHGASRGKHRQWIRLPVVEPRKPRPVVPLRYGRRGSDRSSPVSRERRLPIHCGRSRYLAEGGVESTVVEGVQLIDNGHHVVGGGIIIYIVDRRRHMPLVPLPPAFLKLDLILR